MAGGVPSNTGLPLLDNYVAETNGAGVPTIAGVVNQRYWRTDGAAGTRLYICTAAGAAGSATWVAIAGI